MKLMQRLGGAATSKYNDEYIGMIKKYPGSCDDVWIATRYGYPKNETHREFADFWKVEAENSERTESVFLCRFQTLWGTVSI